MIKFIVKDKTELEKFVADRMATIIKENKSPKFIFATGNSPVGVYKNLIKFHQNEGLSFKSLTSYNLDEYRDIEKYPEDSFRKFMDDNLFNHVDIDKSNTHFPDNLEDYDADLDAIGLFDFTILGVGTNGHIAFNEPGTKFEARTKEIKLEQSTIESNFPGRDDYPTKAVTMGLYDIYNKSKEIILLAWGEGKREALNKLKAGIKTNDFPITHFIDHPNIIVVTDIEDFKY